MLRKLTLLLLLASLAILFAACSIRSSTVPSTSQNSQSTQSQKNARFNDSKISIAVSFNAMREFADAVGKDKVDIKTIIPDGTEPHDYDPKASDIESLGNAKIFIYNGLSMESWVDKALKAVNNKNLVVVEASKGLESIKNTDPDIIKNDGDYDPHVWISLKGAENEAKNIKDALVKVDPSNKDYYERNYNDFNNRLEQLFNDYNSKFSTTTNKSFVTGHAAFAYLCKDFGLKQNSVEDVFAGGEPSAKKLKDLVDYCKQNNIKTVFVEDMVSPKVSDALATEVGAKVEKIYTIESKEDNKDYIQCMKDNLEMIYNSIQ